MERRKRKLGNVSHVDLDILVWVVDLRSNDSNGKAGSVQAAGRSERGSVGNLVALIGAAKALLGAGGTVTKGSVDVSGAA
jgi:hypothetical protein